MSESQGVWERAFDFLERVLPPRPLVVGVLLASAVLIFDPWSLVGRFGITADVERYRFWIFLAFIASLAIAIFWVVEKIFRYLSIIYASKKELLAIRGIKISKQQSLILAFVDQHYPDSIQLDSSHPDVRALRRLDLVSSGSGWVPLSNFDDFVLTDKARSYVQRNGWPEFVETSDSDVLEYLKIVTGLDLSQQTLKHLN